MCDCERIQNTIIIAAQELAGLMNIIRINLCIYILNARHAGANAPG